jgi:hypothetical protein
MPSVDRKGVRWHVTVLLGHYGIEHVLAERRALRGPLKQVHVHRASDVIHAAGSIVAVRGLVTGIGKQ